MNSTFSILKKAVITFSFFCFLNAAAQVQVVAAPEKMSYQAVIRNASNNLVASQAVGMQISILKASATGTAVYVETQTPTTNANGLVSLQIGSGTLVSGAMGTIDWSQGPYFIKTETDPTGGTSYTITGTTQLLSVPYALYAKTSGGAMPTGGTANQVLAKVDGTNYNTQWVTPASGGSTPTLQLRVAQKAGVSYTVAGTSSSIANDLVDYDTPTTNVSTQFDTTTDTFTVSSSGLYTINVFFAAAAAGKTHNLYIELNGSTIVRGYTVNTFENLNTGSMATTKFLTAGDTLKIKVRHNNTVGNTSDASGFFEIIKLN